MGGQRMNATHTNPILNRFFAMKQRIITLLLLSLCSFIPLAQADVLQVRGNATPSQIASAQNTTLNIQWQVFADTASAAAGVNSVQGQLIDPRNNSVLSTQIGTLSGSGTSPLSFSESLIISAANLQQWQNAGLKRVLYKRTFTDPASGSSKSGAATISLTNTQSVLSRELSAELVIQRLSLHFNDLQRYAVVETNSLLNATLTLEYRGQGMLNGRWQWAYDDGSETRLQYRTLQVIQQTLPASQRYELRSPALAVERPGRYRVRFCLATDNLNSCAEPVVEASYQVMENAASNVQLLKNVTPASGVIKADAQFSWPTVNGGVVYQLQLFKSIAGAQPEFVTGMWLPATASTTQLSNLVRSKLKPGAAYIWRLEVFDQHGNLLARSDDFQVTWQP